MSITEFGSRGSHQCGAMPNSILRPLYRTSFPVDQELLVELSGLLWTTEENDKVEKEEQKEKQDEEEEERENEEEQKKNMKKKELDLI